MNYTRQYYFFALLLPIFFVNTGCKKDYSFEGANIITDSVILPVSPGPVVKEFPDCALCNVTNDLSTGHWNFKTGNSFLCGGVTNSGFFAGYSKTDFTLFGPSACSADTGLVLSVYLSVPLDQDRTNLTASATAFYYYDNTAPKDIFISMPDKPFSVTVQRFVYSTGIATGTFSGTVFKANGDTAFITQGNFKVIIK